MLHRVQMHAVADTEAMFAVLSEMFLKKQLQLTVQENKLTDYKAALDKATSGFKEAKQIFTMHSP